MPSAARPPASRRARRRCWRRSCPIRWPAAPAIPAPACAVWPRFIWRGRRPPGWGVAGPKIAVFEPISLILNLALSHSILYKRGLIGISARADCAGPSACGDASPTTLLTRTLRYGRSEKKNIALAAWHAPLRGCDQEADLRRRQGFRRIAPSASPRSENRHVQGPPGSEEKRILSWMKRAPPHGGAEWDPV